MKRQICTHRYIHACNIHINYIYYMQLYVHIDIFTFNYVNFQQLAYLKTYLSIVFILTSAFVERSSHIDSDILLCFMMFLFFQV